MKFIDLLNKSGAKYLINSDKEFITEFGNSTGFGADGDAGATDDLELARKIIAEADGIGYGIWIRSPHDEDELEFLER